MSLPPLLPPLLLLACSTGFADPDRAMGTRITGEPHPVRIHHPTTLGVADTREVDIHGTPIGVACATCHGGSEPLVEEAGNPEQLHGAIELEHGELPCASCHDPDDRSLLRLADGTRLEMADTMLLCAQCHGTQHRDYQQGAHGGMAGYWDLRQGPRSRNHCVDCHGPHAPRFEGGTPVHSPRDRFFGAAPEAH